MDTIDAIKDLRQQAEAVAAGLAVSDPDSIKYQLEALEKRRDDEEKDKDDTFQAVSSVHGGIKSPGSHEQAREHALRAALAAHPAPTPPAKPGTVGEPVEYAPPEKAAHVAWDKHEGAEKAKPAGADTGQDAERESSAAARGAHEAPAAPAEHEQGKKSEQHAKKSEHK